MAAEDKAMNRDTLTNESGSHPVATGVGAAGGAAAGIAAGTVGGPVGMAVGGVVGAVVGGLAGRAAGEAARSQEHPHAACARLPARRAGTAAMHAATRRRRR